MNFIEKEKVDSLPLSWSLQAGIAQMSDPEGPPDLAIFRDSETDGVFCVEAGTIENESTFSPYTGKKTFLSAAPAGKPGCLVIYDENHLSQDWLKSYALIKFALSLDEESDEFIDVFNEATASLAAALRLESEDDIELLTLRHAGADSDWGVFEKATNMESLEAMEKLLLYQAKPVIGELEEYVVVLNAGESAASISDIVHGSITFGEVLIHLYNKKVFIEQAELFMNNFSFGDQVFEQVIESNEPVFFVSKKDKDESFTLLV